MIDDSYNHLKNKMHNNPILTRKRQSERECVVLERMRILYLEIPAQALATSSVRHTNARGRANERYTKEESKREKESVANACGILAMQC